MDVLLSVVAAFLSTKALLAVARHRGATASTRGAVMMHSVAATVVGGLFSVGAVLAFMMLALLPQNQSRPALLNGATAFAVFVVPASWFFCEAMRRRVLVTRDGIIDIGRRGRRRRIRWCDVVDVTHSGLMGCFFVHRRDGRRLMISQLLVGQKDFAQSVLSNVSAQRLECEGQLRDLV